MFFIVNVSYQMYPVGYVKFPSQYQSVSSELKMRNTHKLSQILIYQTRQLITIMLINASKISRST